MTSISSISGYNSAQPLHNSNLKLQEAIARLVGLPGLFPTVDNVAGLSTVAKLQAQNADIRQLSGNIAQAVSLSQVADSGVSQIQEAVQQLQSIVQQAQSGAVDQATREALTTQVKQIAQNISTIATSTQFGGQSLLNGSLSGDNALSLENAISGNEGGNGVGDLSIGNLTASALFGGLGLSLAPENINATAEAIGNALQTLGGVRSDINVFQQALEFASANVDSALANQQAAQSSFSEEEQAVGQSGLQQSVSNAIAAQASQLSPTLLKLIS